jgi:hypothetical protein
MNTYTAVQEFSLPVEGKLVTIGMSVAKYAGSQVTVVGGVSYTNKALYEWVGSVNSLLYLSFGGVIPDPSSGSVVSGSFAVTSGSDSVVVTGAAFGFVPSMIIVTVIKPSSANDNLFATVRNDSITADGFTADLSAPASVAVYILAYVATA